MEQGLYDLMDWAGIEELVYSETSNPHAVLGPHLAEEGLLIQALVPTAAEINVKISSAGKKYPIELTDEAGFFAALTSRKNKTSCTLVIIYDNGVTEELYNPYSFAPQYREEDLKKFTAGIHHTIYRGTGTHPMTVNRVSGVHLSAWAPYVMRVNMVGDFSPWDGGRRQMRRLGEGGGSMFELFIPGLHGDGIYKYKVKTGAGGPMLRADPYTNYAELHPNSASIVWSIDKYEWNDKS